MLYTNIPSLDSYDTFSSFCSDSEYMQNEPDKDNVCNAEQQKLVSIDLKFY